MSSTSKLCAQITFLAPHEAYNFLLQRSVLMLDCCATQQLDVGRDRPPSGTPGGQEHDRDNGESLRPIPPRDTTASHRASAATLQGAMAGSAWLNTASPLCEAAAAAVKLVLDELTPDEPKIALVFFDANERAVELAEALRSNYGCRKVFATERAGLVSAGRQFLFWPGAQQLILPSEIVPGKLFLGSRASLNTHATELLGISAVVSLLDTTFGRPVSPPEGARHVLVPIADRLDADLDMAIQKSLPFIFDELTQPYSRVLVHCEAGQSRSASIVIAALLAQPQLMGRPANERVGVDKALAFVQDQRPQVRPNDGFMYTLRKRQDWQVFATAGKRPKHE